MRQENQEIGQDDVSGLSACATLRGLPGSHNKDRKAMSFLCRRGTRRTVGVVMFEGVLARFRKVRKHPKCWSACCPAHEDKHPSLTLWISKRGDLLAKCRANKGCTWREIVAAVGTEPEDWWGDRMQVDSASRPMQRRRFLVTGERMRTPIATYDYPDEQGEIVYQVCRFEPKDFRVRRHGPGGKWVWGLAEGYYRLNGFLEWNPLGDDVAPLATDVHLDQVDPILYRLPQFLAKPEHPVIITEGEKDADTLAGMGFLSTSCPFGAGKWNPAFGRWLKGRRCVVIPDADLPGWNHAGQIVASLMLWEAESIRVVSLPAKDVTEWFGMGLAGPSGNEARRRELVEIVKETPEWKSAALAVA